MKIRLQGGLPYVTVTITNCGQQIIIENVLLDTASGGTILSIDKLLEIGIQ